MALKQKITGQITRYFRTEAFILRKLRSYFEDLTIRRLPKTERIYLPLNTNKFRWQVNLSDEEKRAIAQQSTHVTARIEERCSVLDVGGHSGYYGVNVARQFPNSWVISAEPNRVMARTAQRVAEIENIINFTVIPSGITPSNVFGLPRFDYTINLSVYHQWVRSFGFESAQRMLNQLWEKTNFTMFFSMADTMGSPKNLNHLPDMGLTREACKNWIQENVLDLPNSRVSVIDEILSSYESSLPRFLFVISRIN